MSLGVRCKLHFLCLFSLLRFLSLCLHQVMLGQDGCSHQMHRCGLCMLFRASPLCMCIKDSSKAHTQAHLFIFFLRFRLTLSALMGSSPLCSSSHNMRLAMGSRNSSRGT